MADIPDLPKPLEPLKLAPLPDLPEPLDLPELPELPDISDTHADTIAKLEDCKRLLDQTLEDLNEMCKRYDRDHLESLAERWATRACFIRLLKDSGRLEILEAR